MYIFIFISFTGHTIFTLHQILEQNDATSGVMKEFQEWFTSSIFSSGDTRTLPLPAAWFDEFQTLNGQNNNSQRIQQLFLPKILYSFYLIIYYYNSLGKLKYNK